MSIELPVNNKKSTKHDLRPCVLYTVEGEKNGVAYAISSTSAIVKSLDFTVSTMITIATYERKYEGCALPTFYTF